MGTEKVSPDEGVLEHNLARIKAVLAKPELRAKDRMVLVKAKARLEAIAKLREKLPLWRAERAAASRCAREE